VEITPASVRLRKVELAKIERVKIARKAKPKPE
jgi:predicted membrane GTPase involved in stress response